MKPPVVVVVDADESRRLNMASAFLNAQVEVCQHLSDSEWFGGSRFVTIAGAPCESPPSNCILLCHFSDHDIAAGVPHSLVVYYGGSGGADRQAQGERIWRPVTGTTGALSPVEATALLAYAALPPGERNDQARPTFLKPPARNEALNALAILCQGYLIARVMHERSAVSGGAVQDAMSVMCWSDGVAELLDSGDSVRQIKARSDEVQWRRWWTHPLEHLPLPLTHAVLENWGVSRTSLLPPEVTALLTWLSSIDEVRVTDDIVAKAFCEIAARLGG